MPRSFTTPQGQALTLDDSQDTSVTDLLEILQTPGSEATLAGAAGCGKTVLMHVVQSEWPGPVLLLAPTGKAANRLAQTTGRTVKTIHSAVFKTVEEQENTGSRREQLLFGEPDTPKGVTTPDAGHRGRSQHGERAAGRRASSGHLRCRSTHPLGG